MSWVIVIPKDGRAWQLFKKKNPKFFFKKKFKKSVSYQKKDTKDDIDSGH